MAFLVVVLPAWAEAAELTYVDLLKQLTDLDRLTHLQTGTRAGQYSSWHRNEREQWAFNADAGQYLRVEENGEAVMMDQDGPGCIFRIWSANPQGTLRIYLDGATTPTYELDFNGLFTGDNPPFLKPLVYKRGEQQSASDCYVPIPFARHIRICADKAHGQFYHFNYLRYPDDWSVPSFRLPLTAEETAALQAAAKAWGEPADPKPKLPKQATIRRAVTLEPGKTLNLADLKGPGQVRAIRMKVDCAQRYFWRKLVLKGTWDGAEWPQVLAPIGPFFGFDWKTAEYGSLIAGCRNGLCSFYYPMPFRRSATLELRSFLELPAQVEYEVEWAPAEAAEDMVYFFARWRQEPDSPTLDYPFIETAGRGHLVGVSLQVDHPTPGWWGEGDEKVWVDDDDFPPWIGTGSEDYFGDAWGIRYLPEPSFGCSLDEYPRTCPYRWHFLDFIPFEKRLRMTIENYGCWPRFEEHETEYSSVTYWYQAELTPPFERLRGVTYTGGTKYLQTPEKQEYRTDLFRDITAADVTTSGLNVPFALEAEDLLGEAVKAGKGKVITDTQLAYEFSRERAVDFGTVKAGDVPAEFRVAAKPGVYLPTIYTTPEEGAAELSLRVGERAVSVIGRPEKRVAAVDAIEVGEEGTVAQLVAQSEGRAVVDCFRLEPAPRVEDAIEAESVEVVSSQGGQAPRPSAPMRGPSAGRVLEWLAAAAGDSMTLRVPKTGSGAYVLGMCAMTGPSSGIIQAFAEGKAVGPRFDLYTTEERPAPTIWPLGQLPGGEVEIRVAGQNPAAKGCEVRLDYFRWEPLIIHPESAEGVWARVLKTQGCEYRIQDLGARFVGGHHLWLQPCRENGFVDIGLNLPEEGDYTIEARYTTSWDYAILQAFLDEKPVGERVDLYTPTVEQTQAIALGRFRLTAGEHVLRFQAVDRNAASKGHLMGVDYVLVKRAE